MTRVAVTTPYFDFFPKLKAEFETLYPARSSAPTARRSAKTP
jgi:hypothetical protein